MASSSSSSSISKSMSSHGWTFDVFLSFAGKDTRKGFVGHLYTALVNRGIHTFRDDQLRMGDSISIELLKSIEESRISVVVFSEKYGASGWCLVELEKIMDCRERMGQIVIPVFYNVDPSDVRRQKDVFGDEFRKLGDRYRNDLEKVEGWKKALVDAASISGSDLSVAANGDESDCISNIVQAISSKCHRNSSAAKNLVGIASRVQKVKSLLSKTSDDDRADVRIIGIWGMGGAGKTTLAWAVYNEISNQFQGRSYVANIREESKTSGLHTLQGRVLSELLFQQDMKVSSINEGIELMAIRLCRKKILLVLDDVDDGGQLDALAGSRDWFGTGSRVIITTRDKHCLNLLKKDEIYKSIMLDDADAMQLFSLHAFGRKSPPEEHKKYSNWVVSYAAGLPLALKVVGSFLYGRGIDEWKSALNRLEAVPDDKVNEILKISFDGLTETEQKIFLDIACFFKDKARDDVTKILDSFDFYAGIGIDVLIQRSLISVSSRGRLRMHDRIQEMGWRIVRRVSKNPGEHSRVWIPEDVCNVLTNKTGTDAVESMLIDFYRLEVPNLSADSLKSMHELRLLIVHGNLDSSYSRWSFKGIYDLFRDWSSSIHLPNKLQWLSWRWYGSKSLPKSFQGENLVGLELINSHIRQLWKGRKNLHKLRFIDLSSARGLISTPDLSGTPNLESLNLDSCNNLIEVHPSVGDLKQLVYLSLERCFLLESLPPLKHMESLETLILSHCNNLTTFPEIGENMGKLSKLDLAFTSIEELPKSIGNLTGLVSMNLNNCCYLTSLPDTICRLKCLKILDLTVCIRLEKLPRNLGEIHSLEELLLDASAIKELPSSIEFLKNLKTLSLNGCKALAPSLILSSNSYSFKCGLQQPLLISFGFIKKLIASKCNLSDGEFPGDLCSLFSLEELNLSRNPFKHLPYNLCQLPRLKILDVSHCSNLEALQALPYTISILRADNCVRLRSFLDFTKYEQLWNISLLYNFCAISNLAMQSLLQGHLVANHRSSIVGTGDTLPGWFSQQNEGNHMDIQLPLGWCNGKFLGFAISAIFNNSPGRITVQFDMSEEKRQHLGLAPQVFTRDHKRLFFTRQVWLGFMSFEFFRMLFPELKQDDWTQLKGNLCMRLHQFESGCETYKCAIRLVYEDDVKGVATIQNSAGILDDSTGWPQLKYYIDEDDSDGDNSDGDDDKRIARQYSIFSTNKSSVTTAYVKQTSHLAADLCFKL